MLTKEWSTKFVNFMTPGGGVLVQRCGHISYIVKMHFFFKNLLLYSQALIRQTKSIVMFTKEGSTKIGNFMTSRAGGSCARAWPCKSYSENALFQFISLKIFFSTPRHRSDKPSM